MVINKDLAKQRNLSDESIAKIEEIHTQLSKLLARAGLGVFNTSVYNAMQQLEFQAQDLWDFPQDPRMHTWCKLYEFRCQWVGRSFKCNETGVEVTLPLEIFEGDFIPVGKGFVDVGRLHCYARFGGVTEVTKKSKHIQL